jgi:hypothetical protein
VSRIVVVLVVVAVLVTCGRLSAETSTTSRTEELPPLHASFADLQTTLDKISSLVNVANKDSSIWQEKLQLQKKELRLKIPGHLLKAEGAKIPPSIDRFEYTGHVVYTGLNREEAPITQVAISFDNFDRSVSVEGHSPERSTQCFLYFGRIYLSCPAPLEILERTS